MQAKVYLERYRLYVDPVGLPLVIRRSANEATFKAEDLTEHKNVALQVVPVVASRSVVREQLEADARTAQKITHINIPRLQDFGLEDGQIVYVTEYFDGTTAENWVKTHGPLPVGAVLRIAQQVVNASSVATFHGLVHLAINPSNIMLVPGQTTEGEWPLIKLLNVVGVEPDFAPARTADPESADPVNFASPEQLQHDEVDFRSQMYSLGATLWFLLTGKAPVGGAAGVEQGGRVPSAVRRLLMQMLAADPGERPLDPLALQAAIRDCLTHLDRRDAVASKMGLPLASEKTTSIDKPHRSAWRPLAFAAAVIALAAVAAAVFAGYSQRRAVGVPIGVPENSGAVAANTTSAAAVAPNESNETPAAAEPPVLTSTAEAPMPDEASDANSSSAAVEEPATAEVAANESPSAPVVETAPPRQALASNSPAPMSESEEPEPPTEGPDDAATADEPAVVRQNTSAQNEPAEASTPAPEPSIAPVVVEQPVVRAKANLPEKNPAAPKPPARRVARQTRPASRPAEPRGSVRAQYLGTTPQGELVFGLPSNETVYAVPPRGTREETPPPRRARRILRAPDEQLPVLPALPPDE